MAEQLALKFGHDANVIGWQIDNEYANESYDAGTKKLFQDWCKARYGTLENLNAKWTTAYWSETYQNVGTRFRSRRSTGTLGCC